LVFFTKGLNLYGEFLKNDKTYCWFIKPFYKDFDNKTIVFSDVINVSKFWQRDIYNISIKNPNLQKILDTFRESAIFYSSDLCGTDFKQVIDFFIKK